MRFQSALLARYAEVDEHGLLNVIGGGLDVFGTTQFPAVVVVAVAIQFTFQQGEAGATFELGLEILNAELETVGEQSTFRVTPELGEHHEEHADALFAIAGSYELLAEQAGNHSVRVTVDGAPVAGIPYRVFYIDPDE